MSLPAKAQNMFKNNSARFIEKNHSTKSAVLCEQGSLSSFPILTLFAEVIDCNDIPEEEAPGAATSDHGDAPAGAGLQQELASGSGGGETGASVGDEQGVSSSDARATELGFQPKPKNEA